MKFISFNLIRSYFHEIAEVASYMNSFTKKINKKEDSHHSRRAAKNKNKLKYTKEKSQS